MAVFEVLRGLDGMGGRLDGGMDGWLIGRLDGWLND